MLKLHYLQVSGPETRVAEFFGKAQPEGSFTLAPWILEDVEDEESPDDFGDPSAEVTGEAGTASWESGWSCYSETMFVVAAEYADLSFSYSFCEQEGDPHFLHLTFQDGECVGNNSTDDPKEAREWNEWFRYEADEWSARLEA